MEDDELNIYDTIDKNRVIGEFQLSVYINKYL